jgi:D-lactate dehydrogenase (cytochrome)
MEARHSMPASAVETVKHRGTFTVMTDTVVPRERFGEFLAFTNGLLVREGLDFLSFGHLGDCHLHFTVLPEREQVDAAVAAYDAIVAKSAELGGVYSGEHGTGKRKRRDFLRCYGPEAAAQVRASKAAVDPGMLLNRGNVFES